MVDDIVPEELHYADSVEQLVPDRYLVENWSRSYLTDGEGNQLTSQYRDLAPFSGDPDYLIGQRGSLRALLSMDGERITGGFQDIEQFSDGLFLCSFGALQYLVDEAGNRVSGQYHDIERSTGGGYIGRTGVITEDFDAKTDGRIGTHRTHTVPFNDQRRETRVPHDIGIESEERSPSRIGDWRDELREFDHLYGGRVSHRCDRPSDGIYRDTSDEPAFDGAFPWSPSELTVSDKARLEFFEAAISAYVDMAERGPIDIQHDSSDGVSRRQKDALFGERIVEATITDEELFTDFFDALAVSTPVQGSSLEVVENARSDGMADEEANGIRPSITAYDTGAGITYLGEVYATPEKGADSESDVQATVPYIEATVVFDRLNQTSI